MDAVAVDLRNQLERVVVEARAVAESGARVALESLAVSRGAPLEFMTDDDRQLRNRLRAHGRQLGDIRNAETGIQGLEHLVNECAYQLWHRMLFGRFLVENHLLIEPTYGVAITVDECEELARERGGSPWDVVSSYIQFMLPDIFPYDSPVFQVKFAPETRQTLERLLESLPPEVFIASDSLGWTYQFWQKAEKKRVNDRVNSGEKVSGDMLPAITQLFTEDYMVRFLLHNTIGAWYAGRRLATMGNGFTSLTTEEAVRRLVSPTGYDMDYLRLTPEDEANDRWRPLAGTYDDWPMTVRELKILDPACGSGHFLVSALELLVRLRMEEEGIPLDKAVCAVLNDNLFGLEIDPRCAQIAAFNLAFSAWKMVGSPVTLSPIHVACSGLQIGVSRGEWKKVAGDDVRLRDAMDVLFDLFQQAPDLGSLIDPPRVTNKQDLLMEFGELQPLLDKALSRCDTKDERHEAGIAAQGMAAAAKLMTTTYNLVVTNVPYLPSGSFAKPLFEFARQNYPDSRRELGTIFLERLFRFAEKGATIAAVSLQNWLFLTGYTKLRKKLLATVTFNVIARLGAGAFETITGEVVNVALQIFTKNKPDTNHKAAGFALDGSRSPVDKSVGLKLFSATWFYQKRQMENPDARIIFDSADSQDTLLSVYANSWHGLGSKDSPRFIRKYWELEEGKPDWEFMQASVPKSVFHGGMEHIIFWEQGKGVLHDRAQRGEAILAGTAALGQEGILISQVGTLASTLYAKGLFEKSAAAIVPHDRSLLAPILAYVQSPDYIDNVRRLDKKVAVTNRTLVKVPFDLEYWQQVAAEQYPKGLPQPYSDDPTQWIFHGHPVPSEHPLHVAVARLLGYRWPAELDTTMELSDAARAWVKKCNSLGTYAASEGILPLIPLRGERRAAERLRELLEAAYGEAWAPDLERQLVRSGVGGSPGPRTLDEWLRDRFFQEHSALFHQRPFIWHIWDGRKDGFHALVNYHRLAGPNGEGRRTLESLTYAYLGEWIERQRVEQKEGQEGADARLVAAIALQEQLERILEGNPPYDLFIRWKPLHQQPIGWHPDINDGIRLNIRPFIMAQLPSGRGKTSILRSKVSVRWSKDRGKESRQHRDQRRYPWFWSCDPENNPTHRTDFLGGTTFDGYRWNDLHYSRAAKETARDTEEGRLERG